jgi:hypothetical protein
MENHESDQERFVVNFDDPHDIRTKMRMAQRKADEGEVRLAEMDTLRLKVERWRARERFLATQLPDDPPPGPSLHTASDHSASSDSASTNGASAAALAVSVINRENRKIRAKDVHAILVREGHDLPRAAVANALYYAAKRVHLIQAAPGRGMYAPREYTEEVLYESTNGAATGE